MIDARIRDTTSDDNISSNSIWQRMTQLKLTANKWHHFNVIKSQIISLFCYLIHYNYSAVQTNDNDDGFKENFKAAFESHLPN